MKVIEDNNINSTNCSAVTLGNFDGVHLGHQKLINTIKGYAESDNLTSVVFSFFPHPLALFNGDKVFYTIFTPEEKKIIMQNLGVDVLIQYPFTMKFANLEPEDFANTLFDKLKCKVLVVGENYMFGRERKGNYELLKYLGEKRNINVIKIASVNDSNERVSSTRIRKCLLKGNICEANKLLNKQYFVSGNVCKGQSIGHKIGFPTDNIEVYENKLLPIDGVYMTKTFYNGIYYNSITNIGKNPTVNGVKRTVETHIFDFNGEIYNQKLFVYFYEFIRPEIHFNSVDELKRQITEDKKKVSEMSKKLLN